MEEVTLFIDGERDDRGPISHGESVTVDVRRGEYGLRLVTVGRRVLRARRARRWRRRGGETTFLALIGPGDPTPLDPATTDLRLVPIAYRGGAVSRAATAAIHQHHHLHPCPIPEPPAAPQPEPPDFTG